MISDNELLHFNQQGLIPGPKESEEGFLKRARYCLCLKDNIKNIAPFSEQDLGHLLKEAYPLTLSLFDIAPQWIPLFFSNDQLALWHGGTTWIFQQDQNSPTSAFLQLRKKLEVSQRYLGIYPRKELLAHELSHVGRMLFPNSPYEEIFAYQTAFSSFRRWFGPIIQSSKEVLVFLLVLLSIFCLDIFLLVKEQQILYWKVFWLKLIPIILIFVGIFRLWKWQHRFALCLKVLKKTVKDEKKARGILYRLDDQEILSFGKMGVEEIHRFVHHNQSQSIRWRLIALAYF